ncbi:ABC transporter ATP-binding protein [Microbacterium sp. YY-01]|uniref:ABC transporter ATP-binding protein n=1 Tax=Microbacterium sp. YY-01 TaxID=3421634 RepID=UPI003D185D5F
MDGIIVEGVKRSFGSVHAVRDATFHAHAGKITGLVGPNGAGKTTLLLMLASLLAPDAGTIRLAGVDPVADPASARRMLGWMPDSLGAWPSLTAHESVEVAARLYGMTASQASQRADQLLAQVGLHELAATPARVLSRGQKQKLGLARALVHDPRVLLLDEPASGLDPRARIELRELLRDLAARGCTVLLSSHVLSELDEMADDAVFLVDGAVVTSDTSRVRHRYRIRMLADPAVPHSRNQPGSPHDVAEVARVLGQPAAAGQSGSVTVDFADDHEAAVALRTLVQAGVAVTEFSPAGNRLEDTFMALQSSASPRQESGDQPGQQLGQHVAATDEEVQK